MARVLLFVALCAVQPPLLAQDFPIISPPAWPPPYGGGGASETVNSSVLRLLDSPQVDQITSMPRPYVLLIRDRHLEEELKLSDKQNTQLESIDYLHLPDLYAAKSIPDEPKAFEAYADDIRAKMKTQLANTNAKVASILTAKQLARLKQIGFQIHTFEYTNLGAALSYYGKTVDAKTDKELTGRLAQSKIQLRTSLPRYLHRIYAEEALAKAIGRESFRELTGSSESPNAQLAKAVRDYLEPHEMSKTPNTDAPISRHLTNMHPSRLESGTWIMQDQSLLRMVVAQQKQLQLSDKQILELKELKALPSRSKYEYSYVVSKTGFTEPDFKD